MNTTLRTLITVSLSSLATLGSAANVTADDRTPPHEVEQPGYQGNDFYRAVGKLRGALTCTGSLIAPNASPDAPAYILSNGHCAANPFQLQSSNRIMVNEPVDYTIEFNYFHDSKDKTLPVRIASIAYGTMKGMDIALLKTDRTVAQLREQGLEPFRLSDAETTVGDTIMISGIPARVDALQNATCTHGRQVDVVENNWHWYAQVSNTCQGISTGSSGSPVFNADRAVIGVLNTTSTGAVGETCYNGNPCEVTDKGPRVIPEHNYVVPTQGLSACFDPQGIFTLGAPGCPLPKPSGLDVQNYPTIFAGHNETLNTTWQFDVQTSVKDIRVKKIRLDTPGDSCQVMTGYGPLIQANTFRPKEELLSASDEGVHQYCVIAGDDETARYPEVVQVIVDNTPPSLKPWVNILPKNHNVLIEPVFDLPEYSDFYVGLTTDPSLTCAEVDYVHYLRVPLKAPSSLAKVCVYGYDLARNKGPAFEYLPPQP
ncbi:trypsin-like serine peptidase [Pseudomonas ovata]|uniref:trypsin-like serine peptidase n=1 Tax=Pseudomonas ovata TaxID=1839709 RepID=UPI000D68CDFF|nr:serine protease [Pseudomonas ovata]